MVRVIVIIACLLALFSKVAVGNTAVTPTSPSLKFTTHYMKGLELLRSLETKSNSQERETTWALAQHNLLLAHSILPRAEALFPLIKHYYAQEDLSNAYFWAKIAFKIPFPADQLAQHSKELYYVTIPSMVAELAWLFGDFKIGEFACKKALSYILTTQNAAATTISNLRYYELLYQQKKLITKSFFAIESRKALQQEKEFIDFIQQMEVILHREDLNFTEIVRNYPILQELKRTREKRHLIYLLHFLDLFLVRESKREMKRKTDAIGHTVWGHITQIPIQLDYYYRIATSPLVNTFCETGFNAGHSTLLWLHANPNGRVISFDIKERFYVAPALEFVNFLYPGQVEVIWGDSRTAVAEYFSQEKNSNIKCDLVHVDGDHEGDGAYIDIKNFMGQSHEETAVLLDDTTAFWGPKFAKWATTNEKLVKWFACWEKSGDPNLGNEFCVGKYTGTISPLTGRFERPASTGIPEVPKVEVASRGDAATKSLAYVTTISSHHQISPIIRWVTSLKLSGTAHDIVILSTVTGYVFEQMKWACRGLGCIMMRVAPLTFLDQTGAKDFTKLRVFGLQLYSKVMFMSVGEVHGKEVFVGKNIDSLFSLYEKRNITILTGATDGAAENDLFGTEQITMVTPCPAFMENLKNYSAHSGSHPPSTSPSIHAHYNRLFSFIPKEDVIFRSLPSDSLVFTSGLKNKHQTEYFFPEGAPSLVT